MINLTLTRLQNELFFLTPLISSPSGLRSDMQQHPCRCLKTRDSETLKLKPLIVFFSEKFMVRLNKNGGPKNPEKVDRLCALFTVTRTNTRKQHLFCCHFKGKI